MVEDDSQRLPSPTRVAVICLSVAVIYYFGARLSIFFSFGESDTSNLNISILWLPNAFLAFALLHLRPRFWPFLVLVTALPEFWMILSRGGPPAKALACILANQVEALTACLLISRLGPPQSLLLRLKSTVGLCVAAALAATLGATIAIGILDLGGVRPASWQAWHQWVLGDSWGLLTVLPLMLAWKRPPRLRRLGWRSLVEALVVAAILAIYSVSIFQKPNLMTPELVYLLLPLSIWAAVRFGPKGATVTSLVICLGSVWSMSFVHLESETASQIYYLRSILLAVPITLLALSALIREREGWTDALEDSREHLRALVNGIPDLIFRLSKDGYYLDVATSSRELLFHPSPAGQHLSDILPQPLAEDCLKLIDRALEAGEQQLMYYQLEVPAGLREFEARCLPIKLDSESSREESVIFISRDITEQKQLEHDAAEAEKMRAIGQLTGGVAHDFNNLLTVVLGNLDFIKQEANDPELSELAQEAIRAGRRGAKLTQQLLSYSRRQVLSPRNVDLRTVVKELADHWQKSCASGQIKVQAHLPERLPPCMVDPHQLKAALNHVMDNAGKALDSSGTISVRVSKQQKLPEKVREQIKSSSALMIEVLDDGAGMPEEVRKRAFEPFFSTRGVGEGVGLGLSMVYGFARQSGGEVHIESTPGEGTKVQLFLPMAEPMEASWPPAPRIEIERLRQELAAEEESAKAPAAELTTTSPDQPVVLLVEDDPQVRRITARLLEKLQLEVHLASTGQEASKTIEELSRLDLVVTDLVLPDELSGLDVAQRARESFPKVALIHVSGFSEDLLGGDLAEGAEVLPKPFHRTQLEAAVKKVLQAEPVA